MKKVVQGEKGTAKIANIKGLDMHGKTGTAQNPHGNNHAWFISFSKNPQFPFAQVLFIEYGGSGSKSAAPLARKIFDFYKETLD